MHFYSTDACGVRIVILSHHPRHCLHTNHFMEAYHATKAKNRLWRAGGGVSGNALYALEMPFRKRYMKGPQQLRVQPLGHLCESISVNRHLMIVKHFPGTLPTGWTIY